MPVLNGERYIAQAIGSISTQTYRDFELIVVDDGSTDGTAACVGTFRDKLPLLHYVKHPQNQGIARSVNDGLRHSAGELIAFLDHDDLWLPDFLETQVKYLDSHPDVAMVHSDYQYIDGGGHLVCESVARWDGRERPSGHIFPQLFRHSFICGNSVLIRKPCLDRFGGFDERFHFGDYYLWMRMARQYKIDYVPRPLTQYRQHTSQSTRNLPPTKVAENLMLQATRTILEEHPEIRKELGEVTVRRRFASQYFDLAYSAFVAEAYGSARAYLVKAIRLWPSNRRYHMLFVASLLPLGLGKELREAWRRIRARGNRAPGRPANDRATEGYR
jgi:glycosyltransferase involved in cell wall biosynthesis